MAVGNNLLVTDKVETYRPISSWLRRCFGKNLLCDDFGRAILPGSCNDMFTNDIHNFITLFKCDIYICRPEMARFPLETKE